MELTRADAWQAVQAAQAKPLDYTASPLEAGMGGCPWRILLASLLGNGLGPRYKGQVRATLQELLSRWAAPSDLVEAKHYELAMVTCKLPMGHRKARSVYKLARQWVLTDWDTVVDLSCLNLTALAAVKEFAIVSHPDVP